jgi:hypothetical protein
LRCVPVRIFRRGSTEPLSWGSSAAGDRPLDPGPTAARHRPPPLHPYRLAHQAPRPTRRAWLLLWLTATRIAWPTGGAAGAVPSPEGGLGPRSKAPFHPRNHYTAPADEQVRPVKQTRARSSPGMRSQTQAQVCVLRPLCARDAPEQPRSKIDTDERFRTSEPVWWAWLDLNLGPHPYQVSRAKRCADRRFPRSSLSVRGEGMRS